MVHRSDSELNLDYIVFEGRNLSYGAFDNRYKYNDRLKQALLVVLCLSITLICTQIIFSNLFEKNYTPPPSILDDEIIFNTENIVIEKPALASQPLTQTTTRSAHPNYLITEKDIPEVTSDPLPKPDEGNTTLVNTTGTGLAVDSASGTSGSNTEIAIVEPEKIVDYADEMPQFPGGDEGLGKFFARNMEFPSGAVEDNISGKVYVSFIIGTNGEIREVRLVRGIDKRCDEEAVRVVRKMPNWKPGKLRGKFVAVKKILPIHFKNN